MSPESEQDNRREGKRRRETKWRRERKEKEDNNGLEQGEKGIEEGRREGEKHSHGQSIE
jgi:hypothetical protein